MCAKKIFGILLHVTKTVPKKKYFKKFLYFARLFINYHDILIVVSIYCYLIEYQSRRKYLLPNHDTIKKF